MPGGTQGLMNNPADRLELGSSMTHLLLDRSRRYRSTVISRGRLLKRYKKASANLAKKQAAFEEEMRQFGGHDRRRRRRPTRRGGSMNSKT